MITVRKEELESWVKKQKWLFFQELPTPTGRQKWYITPAGSFIIAVYDLKGEILQIAQPIFMQQPAPTNLGALDIKGMKQGG